MTPPGIVYEALKLSFSASEPSRFVSRNTDLTLGGRACLDCGHVSLHLTPKALERAQSAPIFAKSLD